MKTRIMLALFSLCLGAQAAELLHARLDEKHRAFFKDYRVECHNAEKHKGKLRLDDIAFSIESVESAERWQEILNQLNAGDMPPEDAKQPERGRKTDFLDALSHTLVAARKVIGDQGGGIAMRRLAAATRDRAGARAVIERFVTCAFRGRKPEPDYLDGLVQICETRQAAGDTFEDALKEPLSIVLASRGFLYFHEPAADAGHRALGGIELTTRLSYFLWSAPPDDELLALARSGELPQTSQLTHHKMNPVLEHQDFLTRRKFLGRGAFGLGTAALSVNWLGAALAADGIDVKQSQPWQRREKALLNNCPAAQPWLHHSFYSPCVIFAQGKFHLWFEGTDVLPALNQGRIGYAQSDDGINWKLHPTNPILAADQLAFKASNLSTPCVLFDEEEQIYKMWFVATTKSVRNDKEVIVDQDLGYATSKDGIAWKFHDRVLVEKCRRPCVRKENGRYRMWMNARPKQTDSFAVGYRHVYEYKSADGIAWTRREHPSIVAGGITKSCVYPCVLKLGATYYMWHIGHVAKPDREAYIDIFCDTSDDGTTWRTNHETAAFTAARDRTRWDWKLVSAPCVVEVGDELYLYYMGSNIPTNFNFFDGGDKSFGMHLGLAVMPKDKLV